MQAFRVGFVAFVLGTIGSIAVVVTPSWFPPAASVQADRHDQIYLALMIMSSYIFAIVVCFLGYSMWKFRAKPGDMSDGEPIHGNTMLEIVWTLIPLVLVLGFAVYGAVVLSKNENTSNTQLVVNATGQEFEWTFDYPTQKVTSGHPGAADQPEGGLQGARRRRTTSSTASTSRRSARASTPCPARSRRWWRRRPGWAPTT